MNSKFRPLVKRKSVIWSSGSKHRPTSAQSSKEDIPDAQKDQTPSFRDTLSVTKDILDVVLKVWLLLFFVPILSIYVFLYRINRIDLFLPSLTSSGSLGALLGASIVALGALLIGVFAPSYFIGLLSNTYPKGARPPGLFRFVWIVNVVTSIAFVLVNHVFESPQEWPIGASAMYWLIPIVALSAIYGLGLRSPRWCQVVSPADRYPCFLAFLRGSLTVVAGLFVANAFFTIDTVGHNYLPGSGWLADAVVIILAAVSFLPGVGYVRAVEQHQNPVRIIGRTITVVVLLAVMALTWGFSLEPVTIGAMRALGIIGTEVESFELLTISESPIYRDAGMYPDSENEFKAFALYRFGDVALMCNNKIDVASAWPALSHRTPATQVIVKTIKACVSAGKGEIRPVGPRS